jgi:hypothetical protein
MLLEPGIDPPQGPTWRRRSERRRAARHHREWETQSLPRPGRLRLPSAIDSTTPLIQNQTRLQKKARPQTNKNPTRFQLAERAAESQSSRFLPLPRFASLASIRFDSGVGAQGGRGNRPAPLVLQLSVHFHPAGRLAGSGRGSFLRSRVFLSVALDLWLGSPPAPFRETSLGAECVICLYYFFVFPLLARAVDLLLAPGSVGLVCLEFVRVWAFRSCRPGLV